MNAEEVSLIIINSSLGFIANYHALLTSLHFNWEIVNEHLGKCADERDIEAIEVFTRSPMFSSLCFCSSKRYQNTPKGIKGTRQKVIVTHNPSEIDQALELLVRFPNLGSDDVIIPGTANLSFNIELTSTVDQNRTLVSNIRRAIVKKLAVKFEGNDIMSIDDFDVLTCYQDLWKTKSEKRNAIGQGIISNDGCTENCIKLRINAGNKDATNAQDKAIADAYGNRFIIPLDFEMLDSAAPYYQAGLGNRLCYELTFNDYNRVTKSGVSSSKVPDVKYKITDISLEYEIAT